MNIPSTDFEKKCSELVPKIEAAAKEKAPNLVNVSQFFYLQDTLCLNLNVTFKTHAGEQRAFPMQVGSRQVMAEDIEPVIKYIVETVAKHS